MGTITGAIILARVRDKLFDETGVFWDDTELVNDLDGAFRTIVIHKPDAYSNRTRMQLAAGVAQTLPEGGEALIDIHYNLGTDGNTRGRAIRYCDRAMMDRTDPTWTTKTPSNVAQVYMVDPRDPRRFDVYPPQPTPPGWIELTYSTVPPRYTDKTQVIPLSDLWVEAVFAYVMGMAHSKNTKRGDLMKGQAWLRLFGTYIGVRDISQLKIAEGRPEKEGAASAA